MACRIQTDGKIGTNCGRPVTALLLVLSVLILLAGATWSLVARLYLTSYYTSAHMAGLVVFVCIRVVSHHVCRIRETLLCKQRPYYVIMTIINIWGFLCYLTASICYSMLAAAMVNTNYDYVTAFVFGWTGTLLMFYLLVLSLTASCISDKNSYDVSDNGTDWTFHSIDRIKIEDLNNSDTRFIDDRSIARSQSSKSATNQSLKCCCAVLSGFILTLFHIIFAIIVFLSAYHPASVYDDVTRYMNRSELYTVNVKGHKPLALFVRCQGNGHDTIVFENGLGGMSLMEWDFMPQFWSHKYRVCVHDRRGYGWSEGYTSTEIESEFQWAGTNTQFFRALIDAANISTPFYYAGHSYGGHHLTFMAYDHPDFIKALIYLDTAKFSPVTTFMQLMPLINNFKPLGLIHIAFRSGLLNYKALFEGIIDFDHVTPETAEELMASMRSGYYTESYQNEAKTFVRTVIDNITFSSESAAKLYQHIGNNTIKAPVLVIDAEAARDDFSEKMFSQYKDFLHVGVTNADHQSLVYGLPYSEIVAEITDKFIMLTNDEISDDDFVTSVNNMTGVEFKQKNASMHG